MPAYETTTFTPAELFAGQTSKVRKPITVVSGQNLAANTVLMTNALGKHLLHDGAYANKVAGVLVAAVDATAGDKAGLAYLDGDFIDSKLVWPVNINAVAATNLSKQKLLEGTMMTVSFYNTGEL